MEKSENPPKQPEVFEGIAFPLKRQKTDDNLKCKVDTKEVLSNDDHGMGIEQDRFLSHHFNHLQNLKDLMSGLNVFCNLQFFPQKVETKNWQELFLVQVRIHSQPDRVGHHNQDGQIVEEGMTRNALRAAFIPGDESMAQLSAIWHGMGRS